MDATGYGAGQNAICILVVTLWASHLTSLDLDLLMNNDYDNNNKRTYLLSLL